MAPKLTKNSRAVKLLRQKSESGILKGSEDPKAVYESEEVFQKHKLANFRTCYYNIRKEYGAVRLAEVPDGDGLKRKCTLDENGFTEDKKRRTSSRVSLEDSDASLDESEDDGAVQSNCSTFDPLYLLWQWTEPGTTTPCLSVAIFLALGSWGW